MTEPTDAELLAEWDRVSHIAEAGQRRLACLRAVLAKWGTPAGAGEPVMWAYQYSDGSWHDASATEHSAGMKPLYPPPQPTQAQAGAVPLTCEWTHDENDGFWESACGEAWQFNDGGPADNNVRFCQGCGKPLGIKGGQHVS